jgi:hypothetical protein
MKDKVVEQLRPTLLAYSMSKALGTPTPPLLVTMVHEKKLGTKTVRHVERRTVRL